MARLSASAASLRFVGDDLDPDDLTRLLGCRPTRSQRKGEEIVSKVNGNTRIARTGSWHLKAERREPADLDGQIAELLGRLTDNRDVWEDLARRFRADVFCGLFMAESNEGAGLSRETLRGLAMRGLEIGFDIYDSSWE